MEEKNSDFSFKEFKQNIQAWTNLCHAVMIYNKYFAT